ncbi:MULTISPECIES: helix-turn-helix domain-containing protein [Thermus]|uniref:XRE family transcriptional regulator n=2 Tax=Thermus TaxID=270 RepID=A0A4V2IUJ9_9DEIN|nr:helix-turn-helix transcriptional regulator [Thermus thermamylovorans]TBH17456.1 XRE family transcriptional regulator [Thermus thermamylovorans]
MGRHMDFRDYFQESLKDPESARLYREVLDEELSWLLHYLRELRKLSQKEVAARLGVSRSRISQMETSAGLSMTLEGLARYAQALGLSLRLEFTDEEGEVLARYHVGADEPIAEPAAKGWEPVAETWATLTRREKHLLEEVA